MIFLIQGHCNNAGQQVPQTLQAWREWGDIFKVIEKRYCQPKIFKP